MKKICFAVLVLPLILAVSGCGSSPQASNPKLPSFVLNPPDQEDVIYGIGTAKMNTRDMSLSMAEARARQSLAFQLNSNIQAMITDYAREAGNVNKSVSLQFAEQVGRQITNTKLQGTSPVKREQTSDGSFWVLVGVRKADAVKATANIIENEASRYAEFKAMDALDRMETQLDKLNTKPQVVNH
jgi:hypothetical protein